MDAKSNSAGGAKSKNWNRAKVNGGNFAKNAGAPKHTTSRKSPSGDYHAKAK